MEMLLGSLVPLVACAQVGTYVFARRLGVRQAFSVVAVTILSTVIVTAFRYRVAIGGSEGATLASDTFRYLKYGQARGYAGSPIAEGLFTGDGTLGTIVLSQITFELFGQGWITVFVVGSLAGLLGTWMIAAAIHDVYPQVSTIYIFGICLFPSVLYWNSSFGKEAFSILAMGLVTWGVVGIWGDRQTYNRALRSAGVVAGASLAWIVRPQIAVMLLVAVLSAVTVMRAGGRPGIRRFVAALAVVGVSASLLFVLATGWSDPFGIVDDMTSRHERTSIGASQLDGNRATGFSGILVGGFTAIFRPFPWEAGFGGLVSSLDTALVLFVLWRLWECRRESLDIVANRGRLLVFSGVVILILLIPLAGYGNLGLLARMRSLMVPFLFVVAATLPRKGGVSMFPESSRPERSNAWR